MKEIPATFRGWRVVRANRLVPDESQVPNLAVVMVEKAPGASKPYAVLDFFSPSDESPWEAENGRFDITEEEAVLEIDTRCAKRDKFREMVYRNGLMWIDIAPIRWECVPVTGRDEFTVWARTVAGYARNFPEFYAAENRDIQWRIEQWLMRYSAEHTHPSLRS